MNRLKITWIKCHVSTIILVYWIIFSTLIKSRRRYIGFKGLKYGVKCYVFNHIVSISCVHGLTCEAAYPLLCNPSLEDKDLKHTFKMWRRKTLYAIWSDEIMLTSFTTLELFKHTQPLIAGIATICMSATEDFTVELRVLSLL